MGLGPFSFGVSFFTSNGWSKNFWPYQKRVSVAVNAKRYGVGDRTQVNNALSSASLNVCPFSLQNPVLSKLSRSA